MTKTAGIADVVLRAFAELRDQIEVALIFGSWAKGDGNEGSDVDLLVIGSLSFQATAVAASRVQKDLSREVNPVLYSVSEFRDKLAAKHHFVTEIVDGSKIYLIGNEDDLARLGT